MNRRGLLKTTGAAALALAAGPFGGSMAQATPQKGGTFVLRSPAAIPETVSTRSASAICSWPFWGQVPSIAA
ncbi:twin-arginine translocation signal domain-containing protein [Roseovarius pelagicus]|uniref:Twin-arginine translocation signal domain-containing protein n=1 Tax=Roseovarius pelagicus TaxID=2980108 RepID=A0ABY6DJM7_9RHOB|nr:twin-arginine translocation signal domain-containing protein [Roseovarius pelagicus]UXX85153.1 twin-arginine translocation signal domain-containing protein [Roseovarius pelagicus]